MKHKSQRIVALDYFRGICILIVLLDHSGLFSIPFAYLSGGGRLWVSAAEMFFLLSGITFGIVRGNQITSSFKNVLRKSWKRAAHLYMLNILMVFSTLLLAYLIASKNLTFNFAGDLPTSSGLSLLGKVTTFSYSIGWASFLAYYSIYLILAPFALYILRSRFWTMVPLVSLFLFLLNASPSITAADVKAGALTYTSFAIWQFYFFGGLTLARFRLPILEWFFGLKKSIRSKMSWGLVSLAAGITAISVLVTFNTGIYNWIYNFTNAGAGLRARAAYISFLHHTSGLDFWLGDYRYAVLRPLVALLTLGGGYLLYQKYKEPLLRRTGSVVNAMGRDTLWLYCAQALVIPVISALPLSYGNLFINTLMTAIFLALMWLITKRAVLAAWVQTYPGTLYNTVIKRRYEQPQPVSVEE